MLENSKFLCESVLSVGNKEKKKLWLVGGTDSAALVQLFLYIYLLIFLPTSSLVYLTFIQNPANVMT